MKKTSKKPALKRWQFLYCDEESPPKNGDCHDWRSRTYRAETFEAAMDKMLEFVISRRYNCVVDYECCALHIFYTRQRHGECFPRIDQSDHTLREYVR